MSILSQSPSQLSKEERLTQKIKLIREFGKQSFQQITHLQTRGIRLLWDDNYFTPQEIIDALGTDALKLFKMHDILTTAIVNIAEVDGIKPNIALPTNSFTTLSGSIVVSEEPYTV